MDTNVFNKDVIEAQVAEDFRAAHPNFVYIEGAKQYFDWNGTTWTVVFFKDLQEELLSMCKKSSVTLLQKVIDGGVPELAEAAINLTKDAALKRVTKNLREAVKAPLGTIGEAPTVATITEEAAPITYEAEEATSGDALPTLEEPTNYYN